MSKPLTPPAPKHLSPAASLFWSEIVSNYELEEHDLQRLEIAATCLDRIEQARAVLSKEGITILDRNGNAKAHPGIAIERDSAKLYLQSIRSLGVDVEDDADESYRPDQPSPPRKKR